MININKSSDYSEFAIVKVCCRNIVQDQIVLNSYAYASQWDNAHKQLFIYVQHDVKLAEVLSHLTTSKHNKLLVDVYYNDHYVGDYWLLDGVMPACDVNMDLAISNVIENDVIEEDVYFHELDFSYEESLPFMLEKGEVGACYNINLDYLMCHQNTIEIANYNLNDDHLNLHDIYDNLEDIDFDVSRVTNDLKIAINKSYNLVLKDLFLVPLENDDLSIDEVRNLVINKKDK